MKVKSILCAKIHAGVGGINCGCCRPRRCSKKDTKLLTARTQRRKGRQTDWCAE